MKRLFLISLIIISGARFAAAQENQGQQDPTEAKHTASVQIGAGTDDETTTASSGPQKKPDAQRKPGPCDAYRAAVKVFCLETVLGQKRQGATP